MSPAVVLVLLLSAAQPPDQEPSLFPSSTSCKLGLAERYEEGDPTPHPYLDLRESGPSPHPKVRACSAALVKSLAGAVGRLAAKPVEREVAFKLCVGGQAKGCRKPVLTRVRGCAVVDGGVAAVLFAGSPKSGGTDQLLLLVPVSGDAVAAGAKPLFRAFGYAAPDGELDDEERVLTVESLCDALEGGLPELVYGDRRYAGASLRVLELEAGKVVDREVTELPGAARMLRKVPPAPAPSEPIGE